MVRAIFMAAPESRQRKIIRMQESKLESALAYQIKVCGLPVPVREFVFAPPRKWRFDFSWPWLKLAVECEGGTFVGGGHVRGKGYELNCDKYNTATMNGWRLLRFTGKHIRTGEAISMIEKALGRK